MRVAIMGRSVRPGATGVGRYAANLVGALANVLPSRSLTVFLTRDASPRWNGAVREVRAPFATPNEYARAFWEQTVVPVQTARIGVDVYHSPNYILPLALTCPSVVTVHDLTYLRRELHRLTSHVYLTVLTALAIRRARAIIAVSEYTRRAVEARYPHAVGRVHVVYEGLDPVLRRPSSDEVIAFRRRLGLDDPYILFIGTQEPRKNLVRLVQAYECVVRETGLPHRLILVGARGWHVMALDAAIEASPFGERIHRIGYVPDGDLSYWYAAADLFVYPSLEEGFGLPPLEAMALGVPVVTSSCSSLPEVVGNAALTIDPRDTRALAGAMIRVLTDASLAQRMRSDGMRRAQSFSWEESARQHLVIYEKTVSGGHQ